MCLRSSTRLCCQLRRRSAACFLYLSVSAQYVDVLTYFVSPHRQGTTYGSLFHVTDWFPTLLSAADIDLSILNDDLTEGQSPGTEAEKDEAMDSKRLCETLTKPLTFVFHQNRR